MSDRSVIVRNIESAEESLRVAKIQLRELDEGVKSIDTMAIPENIQIWNIHNLIVNGGVTLLSIHNDSLVLEDNKRWVNSSRFYELQKIKYSNIKSGDIIFGSDNIDDVNNLEYWHVVNGNMTAFYYDADRYKVSVERLFIGYEEFYKVVPK